ncbi:MAG: cobalt ECF transporter T component CbiQ [Candidatus Omnitrophota bacterium]
MHEHAEKLPLTSSFMSGLDTRVKILSMLYFIFLLIIGDNAGYLNFCLFGIILLALAVLSKISYSVFIKRYLVVLPFLFIIIMLLPFFGEGKAVFSFNWKWIRVNITDEGLKTFLAVFIKSFMAVSCLIIISVTTSFPDVIKALKTLKVPLIIVTIFSFMYRYLYLMTDELKKMKMSVDARSFGKKKTAMLRALAFCVAAFFLKSYERSENIYRAMLSRNFDKEYFFESNFNMMAKDAVFFAVFLFAVSSAYLAGIIFR